jgi:hypothetical protein
LDMEINSPLIIVFENDGQLQTRLYPEAMGYEDYGVLIATLVRHVANPFKVQENDVWAWVDKERYEPTTPISELKVN